ncbi:hypothetical protein D3C71_1446480 [compost metagenome]
MFLDADTVAAGRLGLVELVVGTIGPQQGGGPDPLHGKGATHADRHIQLDRWRNPDGRIGHRTPNALGHHAAKGGLAGGQYHGKLFAAVARQGVHGAYTGRQRARYRLQHHITRQMAVGVVHLFEVIDVQHEQQRRFARAGYTVDFTLQHGAKVPAVGQASKGVFEGKLAQAVDQALQVVRRHLAVQCCFAAAGLGHQCVCSIQAEVAQIYKMGSRRIRHK